MDFEALHLIEPIRKALAEQGYTEPTAIQAGAIPPALKGRDVLGSARTGTGKTCAFAAPILQRLYERPAKGRPIRALILTPTRELAIQNQEQMEAYGKYLPLKSVVIFGGVGQKPQVDALQAGADILIATPGRLADLYGQKLLDLSRLEIFVLDEADRMLDMGFIHDVRRVVRSLPERRQTLFFSATMPPDVEKLALDLLTDPRNVKVDSVTSTVEAIDQCLYYVDKGNKKHLLASLLRSEDLENALVFSRTRYGVDRIVRDLKKAGIDAAGIHGDKSQNARQTALNRFKSGECKVLVATDIAARGIDVAGLSHVINYDMPMEPEAYIHRIGRTGRAGRDGKAISFCCIDEVKQLNQVEKLIGKHLREETSDWPMEITTPTPPKVREPRPAKVNTAGQAVPPRKQIPQQPRVTQAPSARQARPARPAAAKPAPSSGSRRNRRGSSAYGRPVQRTRRGR